MSSNIRSYKRIVSVTSMTFTTGTWTYSSNTGIPKQTKTATDETSTINIPLNFPSVDGELGSRITKVEIPVRITTANLDAAPGLVLYRRNMLAVAGAGTDLTASTVTTTDDGVVTAAATDRLWTVTVTTPAWDYTTEDKASYNLLATVNAGASTVVIVYDALVYYDLIV